MKKWIGLILTLALALSGTAFAEEASDLEVFNGRGLEQDAATELDLDGDGAAETVTWHVDTNEYEDQSVALEIADAAGKTAVWNSGMLRPIGVYASDLDSDGRIELFVTGDEMSDDYVTFCLRYADGALTQLSFPDVNRGENTQQPHDYGYGMITQFGDNRLTLEGSQDVLGTYFATRTFALSGDAFTLNDDGLWHFPRDFSNPEMWEYAALTVKQSLNATLSDGTEAVLNPGEKLAIIASDKTSIAYFRTQDGRTGSLAIAPDAERGWGMKVNGVSEDELFEYVPYAD